MLDTNFWKRYFEVYDVLNELIPYQELRSEIIERLDIQEGDRVLDLGSGTGNIAIEVAKKGASVTSIDFSREGTERHQEKSPEANVLVGDITKPLPFADDTFDKIYSNNVLYTIPEEKRSELFKELRRILREGGIIVISNPVVGVKPIRIYLDHLKKQLKRRGIVFTLGQIVTFISPTLKMFYYNSLINREGASGEYKFMEIDDQRTYLREAGFKNVSENVSVYSKQAILNRAEK